MRPKVFVLGAADPEMEEIERSVIAAGSEVRYAMRREMRTRWDPTVGPSSTDPEFISQVRVRSENAYTADSLSAPIPKGAEVYFVECHVMGLVCDVLIDHHRPGDPGYEKEPELYLESSSLGQTLKHLGVEPTDLQRIIAAADHCPTQAYQGMCPGVSPEALRQWRTASRAARRGVTPEEMEKAILLAKTRLETASRICVDGTELPWVRDRGGEIPEASARFNIPFTYAETTQSGRVKMGIMGASPQIIRTWMRECGLSNVYGDPVRGFAGGYDS